MVIALGAFVGDCATTEEASRKAADAKARAGRRENVMMMEWSEYRCFGGKLVEMDHCVERVAVVVSLADRQG